MKRALIFYKGVSSFNTISAFLIRLAAELNQLKTELRHLHKLNILCLFTVVILNGNQDET